MEIRLAFKQYTQGHRDGTLGRKSPHTIKKWESTFELFLKWIPNIRDTANIREAVLRQFFQKGENIGNEGVKWQPSTSKTHRSSLKGFIDWCITKRYIIVDELNPHPLANIPIPRELDRLPEYYTEEEQEKIVYKAAMMAKGDFANLRNFAMVATLLMTGLRRGELLGMKITDIDLDANLLKVRAENAKNRRERSVALPYQLQDIYQKYVRARNVRGSTSLAFWLSCNGDRGFSTDGFRHFVNKLSDSLGFRFKPKKCRSTYAVRMYQGSRDILAVQKVLGHKKITTTMKYATAIPEDVRDAVLQNPINNFF